MYVRAPVVRSITAMAIVCNEGRDLNDHASNKECASRVYGPEAQGPGWARSACVQGCRCCHSATPHPSQPSTFCIFPDTPAPHCAVPDENPAKIHETGQSQTHQRNRFIATNNNNIIWHPIFYVVCSGALAPKNRVHDFVPHIIFLYRSRTMSLRPDPGLPRELAAMHAWSRDP